MAKFKAIFNFAVTDGNRVLIEQALERAYQENKEYLDSLPFEAVPTFNSYGMPSVALGPGATEGGVAEYHKARIKDIVEQTGLFGYTSL